MTRRARGEGRGTANGAVEGKGTYGQDVILFRPSCLLGQLVCVDNPFDSGYPGRARDSAAVTLHILTSKSVPEAGARRRGTVRECQVLAYGKDGAGILTFSRRLETAICQVPGSDAALTGGCVAWNNMRGMLPLAY